MDHCARQVGIISFLPACCWVLSHINPLHSSHFCSLNNSVSSENHLPRFWVAGGLGVPVQVLAPMGGRARAPSAPHGNRPRCSCPRQAGAEPVSQAGGTSVRMYLRKSKMPPGREEESVSSSEVEQEEGRAGQEELPCAVRGPPCRSCTPGVPTGSRQGS